MKPHRVAGGVGNELRRSEVVGVEVLSASREGARRNGGDERAVAIDVVAEVAPAAEVSVVLTQDLVVEPPQVPDGFAGREAVAPETLIVGGVEIAVVPAL